MNGKPLIYRGFADFDDPNRAVETGRHTTFEAFEGAMRRGCRGGVPLYGWVWVEYKEVPPDKRAPFTITRIRELILMGHDHPQQQWNRARIQARKENELVALMMSHAACCLKATHCLDDHQRTTRHFRYWVLEFQGLALKTWPWLKNLIAEEVLT